MNTYRRHGLPSAIISYAVGFYFQFNPSHRDIEEILAERSIVASPESICLWCIKFSRQPPRFLATHIHREIYWQQRCYFSYTYVVRLFVIIQNAMREVDGPLSSFDQPSDITNYRIPSEFNAIEM
jgi:hypothetical protein